MPSVYFNILTLFVFNLQVRSAKLFNSLLKKISNATPLYIIKFYCFTSFRSNDFNFRSILYAWLTLHRNASSFTVTLLIPTLISYVFVIWSFLQPAPDSSIYILLANLFFLGVFLEDLTVMIPPAIGKLPKIGSAFLSTLKLSISKKWKK